MIPASKKDLKLAASFKGLNWLSIIMDWRFMELQSGTKIVARAGFIGMTYLYTGSKHLKS